MLPGVLVRAGKQGIRREKETNLRNTLGAPFPCLPRKHTAIGFGRDWWRRGRVRRPKRRISIRAERSASYRPSRWTSPSPSRSWLRIGRVGTQHTRRLSTKGYLFSTTMHGRDGQTVRHALCSNDGHVGLNPSAYFRLGILREPCTRRSGS